MKKTILSILSICFISTGFCLSGMGIELIENPKITHEETELKSLVLWGEIPMDFSEKNFLAMPYSLVVSGNGEIFVFDRKIQKIFKFSKEFKFIKTFGQTGNGPGEYHGFEASKKLYLAKNGKLYFNDPGNRKIIVYDTDGKLLEEIPVKNYHSIIVPVTNRFGDYYLPSKEGALDLFDKKSNKQCTLLDKKEYARFILRLPSARRTESELYFSAVNSNYDLLPDGRLVIYLRNSSYLYLFKDNRLVNKFPVWPKRSIENLKKTNEKFKKRYKHNDWTTNLFRTFTVDQDDQQGSFYCANFTLPHKLVVYKFNVTGRLVDMLGINWKGNERLKLVVKKNNQFYVIDRNNGIKIFKQENRNKN